MTPLCRASRHSGGAEPYVRFPTRRQEVNSVADFSLSVARGECVELVGESGAGKTQAFLSR